MSNISTSDPAYAGAATPPETARGLRLPTQWLGVAPFFIFAIMFLILPTAYLILGAFQNEEGQFTLENLAQLPPPTIVAAT